MGGIHEAPPPFDVSTHCRLVDDELTEVATGSDGTVTEVVLGKGKFRLLHFNFQQGDHCMCFGVLLERMTNLVIPVIHVGGHIRTDENGVLSYMDIEPLAQNLEFGLRELKGVDDLNEFEPLAFWRQKLLLFWLPYAVARDGAGLTISAETIIP
ncbi:hypothetical protein PIB30_020997 [Stylosanthes scabra]|uniref:Uncharacterized protein n=1 Tax=Stylosanthes scabra TaxID=79078 RepID=A0ABU6S9G8_9FABA|nr:hypothetical protein [Stylosanthes scabra]